MCLKITKKVSFFTIFASCEVIQIFALFVLISFLKAYFLPKLTLFCIQNTDVRAARNVVAWVKCDFLGDFKTLWGGGQRRQRLWYVFCASSASLVLFGGQFCWSPSSFYNRRREEEDWQNIQPTFAAIFFSFFLSMYVVFAAAAQLFT